MGLQKLSGAVEPVQSVGVVGGEVCGGVGVRTHAPWKMLLRGGAWGREGKHQQRSIRLDRVYVSCRVSPLVVLSCYFTPRVYACSPPPSRWPVFRRFLLWGLRGVWVGRTSLSSVWRLLICQTPQQIQST